MDTWVKCSDKLPKKDGTYLVYAATMNKRKPFIYVAFYDTATRADNSPVSNWQGIPSVWANAISHWMPLPKPPEDNL